MASREPHPFTSCVLDQLAALESVEDRRVFSGRGRRHFRVSEEPRPASLAQGAVLEDADEAGKPAATETAKRRAVRP